MWSYERFLAKSEEPMVIFDNKNSIIFCNESATKYFQEVGKNILVKNIFRLDGGLAVYFEDPEPPIDPMVIHQLRAPLTSLKWSIELLQDENIPEISKKELLKNISISIEYLTKLVNDLLSASRIGSGAESPVSNSLLDIKKMIGNLIGLLEPNATAKKQKIILKEKCELGATFIDPNLFCHVFQNLLDNAISYGNENSEIEISISSDLSRRMYIISVKDRGISISDEDRQKIFSKFYRSSAAKTVKPAGTGLGLFIAKSSAEANGGNIWFESQNDKLTTFYFTVPIRKEK